MKSIKGKIAIMLCVAMVMCSTLPSLATGNDVEQTTTSKIVEQLKEDLGEEKATEILNSSSEALSGENETSTTVENSEQDNIIVEESDTEESIEEGGSGGEVVEELEEDSIEINNETSIDESIDDSTVKMEDNNYSIFNSVNEEDILNENIATASDLDGENEVLKLESEGVEINNSLFGTGEPWMWWYLTDGGQTIHYTSSEPSSDGHSVTGNSIVVYSELTKSDITRAVFDDDIIAQTTSALFSGFESLNAIDNISNLNTSSVTDMSGMFNGCKSLQSLNVSGFNTSNVTNMSGMFACSKMESGSFVSALQSIDGLTSFNTSNVSNMRQMFQGLTNIESIDVSSFNTSNVSNMRQMFDHCLLLNSINFSNLFNTNNVTDMCEMFHQCKSIVSLDVSSFDTSNVTNMSRMFACGKYNATTLEYESSLTSIVGLSNFDTSNVTDMSFMFQNLKSISSIDVSSFDTSNVTSMREMFGHCEFLVNLDLSSFDTSSVEETRYMFVSCIALQTIYVSTNFVTTSITEIDDSHSSTSMFYGCTSLVGGNNTSFDSSHTNKEYARIDALGTPGYFTLAGGGGGGGTPIAHEFMANWFNGLSIAHPENTTLKQDVTKIKFQKGGDAPTGQSWDIGTTGLKGYISGTEVVIYAPNTEDTICASVDCSMMFSAHVSGPFDSAPQMALTEIINLNYLNTSNVTNMREMFLGCSNLSSINVSDWNTSNVTNFSYMFYNCSSLASIDVSNFNTSNAEDFGAMFEKCSSLTSIDTSSFDYSNADCSDSTVSGSMNPNSSTAAGLGQMFQDCSSATVINMGNVNASTCRNFSGLFNGCSSLTTLNYTNFDVSSAISINFMFRNCSSLSSIDLSSFNTSNVEYASFLLMGCSGLTSLNININTESLTSMLSMFYGCSQLTLIDLSSFNTSLVTNTTNCFKNCGSLATIRVSNNFVTSSITSDNDMFYGCTSLVGGNNTSFDSSHTNKEYARIDAPGTPGYFTLAGGGAPTLTGITVNLPPTTVKYKVGESFDPTGLKINLNYSDLSTDTVTYSTTTSADFTFSQTTPFDTAGATIEVTIYYGGKSCVQNVEVIEPSSISVKPNTNLKVKYAIDESFDPTNLYINVTYSDTTTIETISYAGNESDFSFSPSTLDTAGTSIPVTITWTNNGNDFTCTQNVEVVELSTISINLPPATTRYIKGTNFDPTGLKINLNYSDNTTDTVTYSSTSSDGFTFNGASTLTLNTVGNPFVITIGYAGKTCEQNVIVAELSGIAITTHATKLNYNAGDTFDPTGMVITLTYSDSVTEPITYNTNTSADFTFSPSGPLTRTGNVITVQYKTFNTMTMEEILNVKELTSITIATNPTKLSYASGQSLNPNGLVLTLTYTDSNNAVTMDTVTYNSTTQNKFVFNPSGTAITNGNVLVTYDGKTGVDMQPTFPITVRQVASISVVNRPQATSYNAGSKLNPNGLSIRVNYEGGTNEIVSYSSNNASDFTFNPSTSTNLNTGHSSVTVTYGGESTTFAISVTQSSGGYVPSGGGGNNGGGGGGGGSIPAGTNQLNNTPTTTQITTNKSISAAISGDTSNWVADPITGKWKLNVTLGDGQVAPASNGFYLLTNTVTEVVNGVTVPKQVNNTYYFDAQGNMVTGWVQTADNKWYFFENAKTGNEGVMTIGWKQVGNGWYYFTDDGSMLSNGVTPDGFVIGEDGKWTQV